MIQADSFNRAYMWYEFSMCIEEYWEQFGTGEICATIAPALLVQ